MHAMGMVAGWPRKSGGSIMRRVIAIAIAGYSLAGCSSLSWDAFKATPPTVKVQLESVPQGADARTSLGPGCKTPCSVDVSAPDSGFSVTYTLNKFQPVTVPVQVIRIPGDFSSPPSTTIDPNPVVAELQPAGPPPKAAAKKKMLVAKKPKSPKDTESAPAGSAAQAPPPPTR
jgi:hypothetical protein